MADTIIEVLIPLDQAGYPGRGNKLKTYPKNKTSLGIVLPAIRSILTI